MTNPPDGGTVQYVTATAGFAYGAVGADIHKFGDGTPVYLLENWRGTPETDPEWLREPPSRMLNARFAVVDFTGRATELEQLRHWRETGPRLAAYWLHGQGGAGKTRLAAHFAAESAATGWKVITATHGPGTVLPPPGSQDMSLDGATGLLIIVDYADRWPHSHLTWLFSNALLHQIEVRTRILLLARTADTLPALRGALANHQAGVTSQMIQPLPDGDGHRTGMFTSARDAFAQRYQVSDPDVIEPPVDLGDPDMGLTLALHIAALVAVDAHVAGRRPPNAMAGLTIYLLDREHTHWASLYGDPGHNLDPHPRYRTPPALMNQTVFAAALTGPVLHRTGTALLERLSLPATFEQTLIDHAVCYPPTDAAQNTVLEPLYPDRIAEDFLALTMPGHPADYPAQSWAPDTANTLLALGDQEKDPAGYLPRLITFLAAATDRWPHLGQTYLYPLLMARPSLAIGAGSAALSALASITDVDFSVLEEIEPLLPDHHVDLDVGAAAISVTLTSHRLATATTDSQRAELHAELSYRLSNAGRREEALAPAEQAVTIRRRLAGASPAAHLPSLALSLNNLGSYLAKAGRRDEAMAAADEAVTIYRRLFQANTAYSAELAMSLTTAGISLSEVGRRDEALAAADEAVTIYQRLAEASPAMFLPYLARSLNNLGALLPEVGRGEEASAPAEEAATIYRRLAEADPAAYLPTLAGALHNLGNRFSEVGRQEEALAADEEAVTIRRRLARANPAEYLPDLARSLNSLGISLSEVGRQEEALAAAQEAAATYRRLAGSSPAAYLPGLATSLNNLGTRLSQVSRQEEALAAAEEAVAICRRLAGPSPAAHLPDLATTLNNLGSRFWDVGRREEALARIEDSVAIRRRLAEASPAAYLPDLASSLNNLGTRFSEMGRRRKGLVLTEEAVAIRRRLAEASPAAYLPDLASSLNNLGTCYSEMGQRRKGLVLTEEAVAIYRRLAEANPATHLPALAGALNNLGISFSEVGRRKEALASSEEAVTIYRRLAQANPAAYLPGLARALNNLGNRLSRVRRRKEAQASSEEAAAISRRLAEASPSSLALRAGHTSASPVGTRPSS